jgi:hypothetical protein
MTVEQLERFLVGLLVAAPFCVALGILLYSDFRTRTRRNQPNRVSSFFDLVEFVHWKNLRNFAWLYTGASAGLIWITFGLLCVSEKIGEKTRGILASLLNNFSQNKAVSTLTEAVQSGDFPISISLLLLWLAAAVIFLPHLTTLFRSAKRIVHVGIGFEDTCDRLVRHAASDIETSIGIDEAQASFLQPKLLPRELASSDPGIQLQFGVLSKAATNASQDGLRHALRALLERHNIESALRVDPPPLLRLSTVVFSLGFYVAAAIIYCAFVPRLGYLLCGDHECQLPLLGKFVFPNLGQGNDPAKVLQDVIIDVSQFSLQVAMPFWIGLGLFVRRQKNASAGTGLTANFIPVAGFQIAISVVFGCFFSMVVCIYAWSNAQTVAFFTLSRALDAFLPCIVAPIITYLWVTLDSPVSYKIVLSSFVAACAGLLYGLVGFCYDCLTSWRALFVEGGLLAFYLILVCGLLWSLTHSKIALVTPAPR